MAKMRFIIVLFFRLIFTFFIFSLLLFLPAGTFDWPEAWAFIIILLTYGILIHFSIFQHDPTVEKSRQRYRPAYKFDFFILTLAGICFILMFIITGFDVGLFQWTSPYVTYLFKNLGFSTFTCSLVIYMLVMRENSYLTRIIETQKEQQIITTGPYSFIRHPMHTRNILFMISIPIALGSILALVPAITFLILFLPRIFFEERILLTEFEEYRDYCQKVRYRLIPRIW
jgi:protein-S-isoprenylcysteine O-methyltransferase Ste14